MRTSIEIKADILKTLWSQDCQGVETIRSSIYNVISALTVASFALSSFLVKDVQHGPRLIRVATDILIVFFIWSVYLALKRDIRNRRRFLELREKMIDNLNQDDTDDFKVFGDANKTIPDFEKYKPWLNDSDLVWIPLASTIAICLKGVLVWYL
jgi:hypothetical protein